MNMYNLIEYFENYADSTASLYQFKRQEVKIDNSSSFKYKSGLLGNSTDVNAGTDHNNPLAHRLWKNAQIMVPLKYISAFFRSSELSFINTKLYMELQRLNYTFHS